MKPNAPTVASSGTSTGTGTDRAPNNIITVIGPHDILLGRKSIATGNAGNARFRSLIQSRKDDYISTSRRRKKNIISKQISKAVADRGGRFLRKIDDPEEAKALGVCSSDMVNAWVEVDEYAIMKKIKQSLRDLDRDNHDEEGYEDDDSSHRKNNGAAKRSHLCSYEIESVASKRTKLAVTAAATSGDDDDVLVGITATSQPDKKDNMTERFVMTNNEKLVSKNGSLSSQLITRDKRHVFLKFLQQEKITPDTAAAILLEEQEKANSSTSEDTNLWHSSVQLEQQMAVHERASSILNNNNNQMHHYYASISDLQSPLGVYSHGIPELQNYSGTSRLSALRNGVTHPSGIQGPIGNPTNMLGGIDQQNSTSNFLQRQQLCQQNLFLMHDINARSACEQLFMEHGQSKITGKPMYNNLLQNGPTDIATFINKMTKY